MTPELKALVEEQAKTFEALNASLDEMRGQITELGSADAVTEDKVEKANKAVSDLAEKIAKAHAEAEAAEKARKAIEEAFEADKKETQERLDTLETAYSRGGKATGEEDAKIEKAVAQFWRVPTHMQNARSLGVELDRASYDAYDGAFRKYLRWGEKFSGLDQKALQVGADADGGYWVRPQMMDAIIARMFETSPMRSIASVMQTGTDAVEWVTDTNDATSGGWVGETESRGETATPEIGKVRISVHEQFANPRITQKLLDDAEFGVEEWLNRKLADKLARTENTAFVTGNGVNQPRGFLDYSGAATTADDASRAWGILQYVATGKSGAFDTDTVDATASPADELVDLMAKLKPIFRPNARWLMARASEAEVRKLRATTGEYLVTMNTGNITGVPLGSFMLFGFPITGAEDMPAIAANSFSIAFGDFMEGYQIVDRIGIRILRDPFSSKPYIQFYTTKRVGGDVINFDAIKLLKFGTS